MNEQMTLPIKTDNSQCGRLLRRFKDGRSVTSLSATILMGITQLGARLTELERKGHEFNKVWIDLPNGKRVKQYSLKGDIR